MAGAFGAEVGRGNGRLTGCSTGFEIGQLETLCESVQAQASASHALRLRSVTGAEHFGRRCFAAWPVPTMLSASKEGRREASPVIFG